MISQTPYVWAWRGRVVRLLAAVAMLSFASAALAADALFPQPLHITRRIEDPLSRSATTVHEYCAGNQIVTLSGDRITISDEARQELTEIDRTAGTYSVTPFAELASAYAATAVPLARRKVSSDSAARERFRVARNNDAFDVTFDSAPGAPSKMEVTFDRNVRLSKAALEVLIGASFPHRHSDVHEALLDVAQKRGAEGDRRIASHSVASDGAYALPLTQSVTFNVDGETITLRSTVVDVRSELVPQAALTIPPGARLVESHAVRLARELREVDQLPSTPHD